MARYINGTTDMELLKNKIYDLESTKGKLIDENLELKAENQELRKALEKIKIDYGYLLGITELGKDKKKSPKKREKNLQRLEQEKEEWEIFGFKPKFLIGYYLARYGGITRF